MALFRRRNGAGFASTASSSMGNRSDNATRWSDMYSVGRSGGVGTSAPAARWLPGAFAVVLIVAVLLGIFGGRAMIYRSQAEKTYANHMLTECNEALRLAGVMDNSKNANMVLSRIRASISAVDALNAASNATGGGYFVPVQQFTDLYNIIDSYFEELRTEGPTQSNRTKLTEGLNALQQLLLELQ